MNESKKYSIIAEIESRQKELDLLLNELSGILYSEEINQIPKEYVDKFKSVLLERNSQLNSAKAILKEIRE